MRMHLVCRYIDDEGNVLIRYKNAADAFQYVLLDLCVHCLCTDLPTRAPMAGGVVVAIHLVESFVRLFVLCSHASLYVCVLVRLVCST